MGTTREALEAALAAEPESVALHSAYADLLIEVQSTISIPVAMK